MNLKLIFWIIRSRFKPYPSEMEELQLSNSDNIKKEVN